MKVLFWFWLEAGTPRAFSFFIMFMYFPPVCSDTFLMPRRILGMQPFGAGREEVGIVLTHELVHGQLIPR